MLQTIAGIFLIALPLVQAAAAPPSRTPEMEGRVAQLTRGDAGGGILLSRTAPHPERTRLRVTPETAIFKKIGNRWQKIRLDQIRQFSWIQVWIARSTDRPPVESIAVVPGPLSAGRPAGRPAPAIQRVGSNTLREHLLDRVVPEYPRDARDRGVKGMVLMEVTIDREGAVENVKLIRGHPMLARAAMEAVRQWTYRPFEQAGKVIPVKGTVVVSFN